MEVPNQEVIFSEKTVAFIMTNYEDNSEIHLYKANMTNYEEMQLTAYKASNLELLRRISSTVL